MTGTPQIRAADLPDFLSASALELREDGTPETPLVFVQLSGKTTQAHARSAAEAARRDGVILTGVAPDRVGESQRELVDALTFTLTAAVPTSRAMVAVPDLDEAKLVVEAAVRANPRAALTLASLLRGTAPLPVDSALVAESLAYSMLLAGTEFARWRASRPMRRAREDSEPAVLVSREGPALRVAINRPNVHNAFDRFVRDGLIEALEFAKLDSSIERVDLRGIGESFCSGGDFDEFGTCADVTTAHLIRIDRSVAARVHRLRSKVHVFLHGACIGAGIEIPSFADHVHATHDAFFQLPEVSMGLAPGAGGTVGIRRRIGRWRTAHLAITGSRIGLAEALDWGLVDDCAD